MKTLATNKLATHPAYEKILHQYNEMYARDGKVNAKKFYEEVILPEIPSYCLQSWYKFLRRFKATAGLMTVQVVKGGPNSIKGCEEDNLQNNLLSNEVAVQIGIQRALNIAAERLQEILDNPERMTTKDAIELLFKAMKAQDSRVNAIGRIREDRRQDEIFQREFNKAAYGGN